MLFRSRARARARARVRVRVRVRVRARVRARARTRTRARAVRQTWIRGELWWRACSRIWIGTWTGAWEAMSWRRWGPLWVELVTVRYVGCSS